ncbi:MAG: 16S rRNA (cytosine(1402)-N(4))-methyltransferase RsmH [Pseudomonadota bacterium]|nr:16S rRNA (cytosine(1402)-N(4))-methyltransferase RsmH [Pseudomonadota bacterium]
MSAEEAGHARHQPVLLAEVLAALAVRPDGIYVDGTFGRGGHSRALLAALGPHGRLLAFDRDPEAVMAARDLAGDARFAIRHQAFAALGEVVRELAPEGVDGVLLDLGVSSPQLDEPARGFSFRQDGPLDMRMDTSRGESAAQYLARVDLDELVRVLREFGEERHALRIARAIVAARAQAPLVRTRALQAVVAAAQPRREPGIDPATRTFQALRIQINGELEQLDAVLPQVLAGLRAGGRLAVISFHSLEDRRVKQFIARHSRPPELPPGLAIREDDRPLPPLRAVGRAVFAGAEELARNPRARSAVLRVAERTAVALQ